MANGPRAEAEAGTTATRAAGAAAPEAGSSPPRVRSDAQDRSSGPVAEKAVADGIRVSCLTNASYHGTREATLDGVHRVLMFLVIVLGAGALIDVVGRDWTKDAFAAGAAILAALDLTFDLSNRARAHAMMKRRYFELLAEFAEGRKTAVDCDVCLERFSAEEEPPFHIVHKLSWNAAQESVYGSEAYRFVIPWWRHALRNRLRQPAASLKVAGGPTPANRE